SVGDTAGGIYTKFADLNEAIRQVIKSGVDPQFIPQTLMAATPAPRAPLSGQLGKEIRALGNSADFRNWAKLSFNTPTLWEQFKNLDELFGEKLRDGITNAYRAASVPQTVLDKLPIFIAALSGTDNVAKAARNLLVKIPAASQADAFTHLIQIMEK